MVATTNTLSSLTQILKEHYSKDVIQSLIYKKQPFLGLIKEEEARDAGGRYYYIPIHYGSPNGSGLGSNAISNPGKLLYNDFQVPLGTNYNVARVSNQLMACSKTDTDAFVKGMTDVIDKALADNFRQLGLFAFGAGYGARGQIAAGQSLGSTTITLAEPEDIVGFEVNMRLVAASASTSPTIKQSGGADNVMTVLTVNRGAGTFTVDNAPNSFSGANNNTLSGSDYLFRQGDAGNVPMGVGGWIPSSDPGSTTFYNVDRSIDTDRLGGIRFDGTPFSIKEALYRGANLVGRAGGQTTHCFMNYKQFANLQMDLSNQALIMLPGKGEVGFSSLKLLGPDGPIDVVVDRNVPNGVAYLLQLDTWKLLDFGGLGVPHIDEYDGNMFLRSFDDFSCEVRIEALTNIACTAPGFNCRVTLNT